jgi:transcriptional regulator
VTKKRDVDAAEVAARMTTYRQTEGLTQRQLADKLNTTRGVIGAMERQNIRSMRVALLALDLVPESAEGVI